MNLTSPFNIKPPRAIECVTRKRDDGRCDIEVEGHVTHVGTGEPIKVKSHTVVRWPPTAEDFRSLLVAFFDHEVREQLGMDPHGTPDPMATNIIQERDRLVEQVRQLVRDGDDLDADLMAVTSERDRLVGLLREAAQQILPSDLARRINAAINRSE